jgi:hypothetical protein
MGSLRKTTYEYLTTDSGLLAAIPVERWFSLGGVKDRPATPYAVLAWFGTSDDIGLNLVQLLQVQIHDEPGSYTRIEDIHPLVEARLKAAEQYVGLSGYRLVQADYTGRSADLVDPDRRTGFQYTSWSVVGGNAL